MNRVDRYHYFALGWKMIDESSDSVCVARAGGWIARVTLRSSVAFAQSGGGRSAKGVAKFKPSRRSFLKCTRLSAVRGFLL